MWEITYLCMKFLKYVENWLKNVENDLEIWEMAKIFGIWLRYI